MARGSPAAAKSPRFVQRWKTRKRLDAAQLKYEAIDELVDADVKAANHKHEQVRATAAHGYILAKRKVLAAEDSLSTR